MLHMLQNKNVLGLQFICVIKPAALTLQTSHSLQSEQYFSFPVFFPLTTLTTSGWKLSINSDLKKHRPPIRGLFSSPSHLPMLKTTSLTQRFLVSLKGLFKAYVCSGQLQDQHINRAHNKLQQPMIGKKKHLRESVYKIVQRDFNSWSTFVG